MPRIDPKELMNPLPESLSAADLALAERVEAGAMLGMHGAAPAALRERLGLGLERVGGGLVETAREVPSTLFNRAIGTGVEHSAGPGEVEAILEKFAQERTESYYFHLFPGAQAKDLRHALAENGLKRGRGWVKFLRGPEPAPQVRTDLEVREIDESHAEDFGRIVTEGFELPEGAAPLLASVVGRPGFRVFCGFDGETPAGAGLLYIHNGTAWFSYAATLPAFRSRGCQGAVLARRIEAAREAGCRLLVTETGEEVEGQPQASWRNIERFGFTPLYCRENWVP
jgi:GNAT superfamily N-acetyltransferase